MEKCKQRRNVRILKLIWRSRFVVLESPCLVWGTFLSLIKWEYFTWENIFPWTRNLLKARLLSFTLTKYSRILQQFLLKLNSNAKILVLSSLHKVGGNSSSILFWITPSCVRGCSESKMFTQNNAEQVRCSCVFYTFFTKITVQYCFLCMNIHANVFRFRKFIFICFWEK